MALDIKLAELTNEVKNLSKVSDQVAKDQKVDHDEITVLKQKVHTLEGGAATGFQWGFMIVSSLVSAVLAIVAAIITAKIVKGG